MYKWVVTFMLPNSGAKMFKETAEASQWSYAKAMLEAKYQGIKITNYTPVKN